MESVNSHHSHHDWAITVLLARDRAQGLRRDCHDPNRVWRRCQQEQPRRKDEATDLHNANAVTPLRTESK